MKTIKHNLCFSFFSFLNKKIYIIKFLILISLSCNLFAQDYNNFKLNVDNSTNTDTTKPVQYRRTIEQTENQQSYEQKYFGKDLNEVKRSLFPLESSGVWTELNPKVPRVDYIGVHFVNKDTGWACGDLGALIKTTNGGISWTVSETNSTTLLLKVHSFNGQIVIVTGYNGTILRSTDCGVTFTLVTSGVTTDLWGVLMLNDSLGFVCGINQTLLKTTDAGQSWLLINTGLNQHYWAIDFFNEQFGMIACGGGKILKTTDSGNSWIPQQAGDTRALYTIDIIDSIHIVAGGESIGEGSKNIYSNNAGLNWVQNANLIYETGVNCITFINTDIGYAVGENWAIRKTIDRGISWFASNAMSTEWCLDLIPNGIGYAAGNELKLYKTDEGYDNWEKLFLKDSFSDVFFINERKGFLVLRDPSKLYKTNDGGLSWDSIPDAPGGNSIIFLDSIIGFIGGESAIYKSIDGGNEWFAVNETEGADKIFFIGGITGWAIHNNVIYKTTNRGENWVTQLTTSFGFFTSVYFIDSLYGWTSGVRPYKTTDGGNNWVLQTNTAIWNSDDVYFSSRDTGWIAKYSNINNSLYKTTDGGNSWVGIPEVIGARKFRFTPDLNRWLIIGFSRYYITYDNSNSWYEFTNEVPTGLTSFCMPTYNIGFAVGTLGLVLKFEDTTYVPVELISFIASVRDNNVTLNWQTATETNNQGFEVQRKRDYEPQSATIHEDWNTLGFVNGNGTTTEPQNYIYVDRSLQSGKYQYRIKQIDYNGTFTNSKTIQINIILPDIFFIEQNYPNPFNSETTIQYQILLSTNVKLYLYNINGELIQELINMKQEAGYYTVRLKGGALSSGVYFYKMICDDHFTKVKKLLLLK